MADDDRQSKPVSVYEAVQQLLPARTWKENPLIWIGLVVAVFLAVPFLASWATRNSALSAAQPGAQAAASAPAAPEQASSIESVAVTEPRGAPARTAATPPPVRAQTDPARQMITKCVERGRVVYTQTGECAGSVTAVPIDTDKNVVGPGGVSPSASR